MPKVSRKRLLLSSYLDFLFATVVVYVVSYFLSRTDMLGGYASTIAGIIIAILIKVFRAPSLGDKFLSIDEKHVVSDDLKSNESFWLMAVATVLVMDGTKQLTRWTQFASFPFFGNLIEGLPFAIYGGVVGLASILAGYLVYKLDVRGMWLSISIVLFSLLNFITSKNVLAEFISQRVSERRAIQDLPVRDGEIQFVQTAALSLTLVFAVLMILILWLNRSRFSARS